MKEKEVHMTGAYSLEEHQAFNTSAILTAFLPFRRALITGSDHSCFMALLYSK